MLTILAQFLKPCYYEQIHGWAALQGEGRLRVCAVPLEIHDLLVRDRDSLSILVWMCGLRVGLVRVRACVCVWSHCVLRVR